MRRLAVTLAVLAAPALAQTSDPFAPSGGQTDPFAPSGAEQADPFAPSGGQSDPFAPAQDTPEADVEAPSDDTAAPAPAPAVSAGLDAADPQGIMEWVQEQGYRAQMTTDSVGDPMITSGAQGAAFDIMFYGCDSDHANCQDIAFSAGFDLDDPLTFEQMNTWNDGHVLGMAFVDEEGDPYIRHYVAGFREVTDEAFERVMDRWTTALGEFTAYIGW